MNKKQYSVYLDDKLIGTSELEKADAPMGMVFGLIHAADTALNYDFFKNYCLKNRIELAYDSPEERVISTRTIEQLKVINDDGVEIRGLGNQITGMDGEGFEITLEMVPYPFYGEEFPHHVKAYENQFAARK